MRYLNLQYIAAVDDLDYFVVFLVQADDSTSVQHQNVLFAIQGCSQFQLNWSRGHLGSEFVVQEIMLPNKEHTVQIHTVCVCIWVCVCFVCVLRDLSAVVMTLQISQRPLYSEEHLCSRNSCHTVHEIQQTHTFLHSDVQIVRFFTAVFSLVFLFKVNERQK